MKKIILLLFAASLFGCTKQESPSLTGEWTLVGIQAGTGGGWSTSTFSPGSALNVRFYNDGRLTTSGSQRTDLSRCDRYEIIDDHTVRLISTTDNNWTDATFDFEGGLTLWYNAARCGYGEQFVRVFKR